MGASYSIVGDRNINPSAKSIPVELVIDILLYLPLPDLTSCQRVNRTLNDIVYNSQRVQHQIDTAIAGVVDNPDSKLSLPERRDALARRQEAWDSCQPQCTTSSTGSYIPPDFVQCGVYFKLHHPDFPNSVAYCSPPNPNQVWARTWSCLNQVRKRDYSQVMALAACIEENDLVAIGIKQENRPQGGTHSFEVDLLCYSSGGDGHPSARESTLSVKSGFNEFGIEWKMKLEIHTNLLTVLLRSNRIIDNSASPDVALWVFDWKTGENIALLKGHGIDAFRFLSHQVIVVANRNLPALELFTLPKTKVNTGPMPMTKVAALGLPCLDNDYSIASLDIFNIPAKSAATCKQRHPHDAAIYTKPFINASCDDIIVVSLTAWSRGGYSFASFVVHFSALFSYATSNYRANLQSLVPWQVWGPSKTRWWYWGPLCPPNGQRCVFNGPMQGPRAICDFNSYRVRYLGKGFAKETETAHISVETNSSCLNIPGFEEEVHSSLPYVKIVPKQWRPYSHTFLDDDRVIGKCFGDPDLTGKEDSEVDCLYFG